MSVLIAEVAGPILECEIDDHLSNNNRYFRKTGFVLDDLHVYAEPFATMHRAIMDAAEGRITLQEAVAVVPKAIDDIKALHAVMDAEMEQRQAAD